MVMLTSVTHSQQLTTIDGSGGFMERYNFESVIIAFVGDSMEINFHANGGVVTNIILISNNYVEDGVEVVVGTEMTADLPVITVIKHNAIVIGYEDGSTAEIIGFKWDLSPRI